MKQSVVRYIFAFFILFSFFMILSPVLLQANQITAFSREKYAQAIKAKGEDDLPKAISLLREAVKDSPDYAKAHLELGLLYSNNIILFDKAPVELMTVIELLDDPTERLSVEARYYLGIIFLKMGDYNKSIEAFVKVIDLDSSFVHTSEIYNFMGVAYYHKDMYQQSIRHFKKSIRLNPPEDKIVKFNLKSVYKRMEHFNLGMTYYFMKDYDAAITEMLTAVEVDTNYFDALFRLGDIYLAKGMPGEALRYFKRALRVNPNHPDVPQVYNGLGVTLYKKGEPQKAIKTLRRALTLRPKYAQAQRNLRNIFGSIPEDKLIKANPEYNKDKYVAEASKLAQDYIMIGLYERGIKLYEEILQLDYEAVDIFDRLVNANTKMANAYFDKNDYKHAVKSYKRVIELQGETPQLDYRLGICYYHQGKYWYNDAIESFTKAVNLEGARYYLGLIYYNRHEYVEAAFHIEEALKNDEEDAENHFLLAKIYQGQGRVSYAVDEIKRAIEIDPDHPDYQGFLDEISTRPANTGGYGDYLSAEEPSQGKPKVNLLDSPKILNEKGIRYAKNNMVERAAANFNAGLKKEPGSIELRNNNALLMMIDMNFEEAEKELLTAALLNPMEVRILVNLAILYHRKKMFNLAKEHLGKARRAEKRLSRVYDILGDPGADISNINPIWIKFKQ